MQEQSLWRLPRVEAETGYKSSSIYRLIKLGQFPAPIKLGGRASAWVDSEVRGWIAGRIELSRRAAACASASSHVGG
ncbi:MAG: helix-turn-helix transcriptional regulator [Actinomycetota bacterium]